MLPTLAAAKAPPDAPLILMLGDSLSAAYGMDRARGWVSLLEERLSERALDHRVVNASISGETTSGGLARLGALLEEHQPTILVIQLGANDGLRGLGLDLVRDNLTELIRLGRAFGSQVVLTALPLPPNYGAAYTTGFQAMFQEVAEREHVPLIPNLLAGVAENWDLMQPDGLHPTAAAQPRMLDNVWAVLEGVLTDQR